MRLSMGVPARIGANSVAVLKLDGSGAVLQSRPRIEDQRAEAAAERIAAMPRFRCAGCSLSARQRKRLILLGRRKTESGRVLWNGSSESRSIRSSRSAPVKIFGVVVTACRGLDGSHR
jgi:hypothetical protein